MTLLAIEHVRRHYGQGLAQRVVLSDVSLEVEPGEVVAIWGARHSGRSTLLRIAAGIEPVDAGIVRFADADVRAGGEKVLGCGIGYCQRPALDSEGRSVIDELLLGLLARGVPARLARAQAKEALDRVGLSDCLQRLRDLDTGESTRVAIARAIVLSPSLLVIDEPAKGVELLDRDGILTLLRSLGDEGLAVLMSAGEATALAGADRALALVDGELRGAQRPVLAEVLPLHRRACA